MQPGAPGRSSSVSERRPRRGGGGGGDGGGGGGAPPPDRALPAREAAFGRRVQQRQRPPRPISRVRVHAAARIRAATRAAARGAKAESEGHVPSPLGLRDEGKAERHLPCRGGAVRRRRGAEAVRRLCRCTGVYRWVQMGVACVASDRRSLSVIAASYARSIATRSLGVEAAAGCAPLRGHGAEAPRTNHCRLGTHRVRRAAQMVAAAGRQGSQLRHR